LTFSEIWESLTEKKRVIRIKNKKPQRKRAFAGARVPITFETKKEEGNRQPEERLENRLPTKSRSIPP